MSKYYNRVTLANECIVFAFAPCGVARKASGGTCPGAKALGAHQHFIQPFKNAKHRPNYA